MNTCLMYLFLWKFILIVFSKSHTDLHYLCGSHQLFSQFFQQCEYIAFMYDQMILALLKAYIPFLEIIFSYKLHELNSLDSFFFSAQFLMPSLTFFHSHSLHMVKALLSATGYAFTALLINCHTTNKQGTGSLLYSLKHGPNNMISGIKHSH